MPETTSGSVRRVDRLKDMTVNRFVCGQIRRLRQAQGLRIADVVRRTGIPLGSYSALETGRCRMSLENLFKLLCVLGASISDVWPHAHSDGQPVTGDSIRLALSKAQRKLPRRKTVSGILEAVAADFGFAVADLTGPRRNRRLSEARAQAAMLVKAEGHLKLVELARALNRDPSSLSHSLKRRSSLAQSQQRLTD